MKKNILQSLISQLLSLISIFSICSVLSFSHADNNDDFVEANILGIFYHELGHALIDIEGIRIFGQEEDAADTFSIFLIDALFEDRDAEVLAYDAAIGFWHEAELRTKNGDKPVWWDVHGPDEQRFFNTVCLFYGANPDQREQYAADLELPDERAESCAEEYDQANESWGAVFDVLVDRGSGDTLALSGDTESLTYDIIESEIENLNSVFSLNEPLSVTVRECDEPNAFYDPESTEIVMCTEFEAHLYQLAE